MDLIHERSKRAGELARRQDQEKRRQGGGKIDRFSLDLLVRLAARAGLRPKLKLVAEHELRRVRRRLGGEEGKFHVNSRRTL